MSRALYRKHRSQSLEEIVGQPHIVSVLKKSLDKGIVSHAYLFTGPRGVGKTSVARILARNINNLKPEQSSLDIIEIDAASNNGVDNIRDLRDKAQIAPVDAKKKVYIIDEVHMLSTAAFNALLKTLEEPPAHVVFILATTNLDKLPATIISRTQHFTFRSIPTKTIEDHLSKIAKNEKIKIKPDAIALIAHQSNGGMRDAISLLDQLSALSEGGKEITTELVVDILGVAPTKSLSRMLDDTIKGNIDSIRKALEELSAQGVSDAILLHQLIDYTLSQSDKNPQYIELLAKLSQIGKNEDYINIRIFTTLGLFNKSGPQTENTPTVPPSPTSMKSTAKTDTTPKTKTKIKSMPQTTAAQKEVSAPVTKQGVARDLSEFEWDTLISLVKEKHMALGSLIVKCKHDLEVNEQKLILYTINKFNKKKLDDPKYLTHLYSILQEAGFSSLTVETIPTGQPPKSGEAAQIADIMGGGEMVEIKGVDI